MKKRNLFLTLGLALTLGAGVAGGLSLNRGEAKEVEAAGVSGKITIDMTGYWAAGGSGWQCNLAMYFYQGEPESATNQTWTDIVYCEKDTVYAEIPYSLSFTPNYMIAVRLDSDATVGTWDKKWNQTADLPFVENANIMITGSQEGQVEYGKIESQPSGGSWGQKMNLTGVKLNGSGHVEYFSDSVTFTKNEQFKLVRHGSYFGDDCVELSEYVEDCFTINTGDSSDSNIVCSKPGTYSVYFDAASSHIFITDPAAAAADNFAQSFLTKTNGYCTGSISESVQTTLKGEYDALAGISGAQAKFYGAEVKRGKGVSYSSFASQALSRYVNMQEEKGYVDFLGLSTHNPAASAYVPVFENNSNNNLSLVIIIASSIALISAGSFFIIRRRKEQE